MKLVRVAAAVVNQTPLDWSGNFDRIVGAIEEARRRDVSILCCPELCISGYGCEDAFHSPHLQATARSILLDVLPHTKGMIVSLGLPMLHNGALFNTACLVVDGSIAGFVAKQNLAGDGIHYEPRWFKAWPDGIQSQVELAGERYPIGSLIFDCGGVRIGFEICEDAWVANRPGSDLAKRAVDIILNPSASHFAFGKHAVRKRFVMEGSRAFHVGYVYANLVGNEAGRAIYDGDAMIANAGRLIATGPRFSFDDYQVTDAVLDIEMSRLSRARTSSFKVDAAFQTNDCVEIPFTFEPTEPDGPSEKAESWETSQHIKEEEFLRAVSLGLFDYMRKSRSNGVVVSLSGGADSAAVATLCAQLVQLGMAELGKQRFCDKLDYLPSLGSCDDGRQMVSQLLTTAYQSTRNSSDTTRNAAAQLSAAIGARHLELDVDDLVQRYQDLVAAASGTELTWEKYDLALQNIQARVRAPSVWLLANMSNSLLLATSNRSEAAVGYTTMDGDTCGGISPIAGIDKAYLREWLRWMEITGPFEQGPLSAMNAITSQQPTAELRPRESKQTDEGDLMPYTLLDEIERLAIRDKLSPLEVFHSLSSQHPDITPNQLGQWITRFFTLWSRNQWKRERFAPSFHLDDENLDPKTWCRFPILSGGFDRELQELQQHLATLSQ